MKLYNFSQHLLLLGTFIDLGYLIPLTLLTILFNIYYNSSNAHYCWIDTKKSNKPMIFLNIPKVIYIIINLAIWILLLCRIRHDKKIGEDTKRFGYKTFGFALIELICHIPYGLFKVLSDKLLKSDVINVSNVVVFFTADC